MRLTLIYKVRSSCGQGEIASFVGGLSENNNVKKAGKPGKQEISFC
jgi:hypothetical protein